MQDLKLFETLKQIEMYFNTETNTWALEKNQINLILFSNAVKCLFISAMWQDNEVMLYTLEIKW